MTDATRAGMGGNARVEVIPSSSRGRTQLGWLDSRHSFSFGEYHDPDRMGFGPLRVINEDIVRPGGAFGMHPHRDMEIITYVLSGSLEHGDSLGNRGVIEPGEIQRISAGSGILHSEANPSRTEPVHFLQIWVMPARRGVQPRYDQLRVWSPGEARGMKLIASPDGRDGSMPIHQDARLWAGEFKEPGRWLGEITSGRRGWVQMARGSATLNGTRLGEGDGAKLALQGRIELEADGGAEVLVFDLA